MMHWGSLLLAGCTVCGPGISATYGAAAKSLTILHTGDIHGHLESWLGWEGDLQGKRVGGFDRLAAAVANVRKEVGSERVLLLDAGDAIGDTMLSDLTQGRAVIDLMNRIGYHAMVLGNHEFDYGVPVLQERQRQATFPILAANIRRTEGSHFMPPFFFRDVGGVRVSILGLGYPNTPLTTARKNVAGVSFEDPVKAAQQLVPELRRQGAELVVVLAHLGLAAEQKLAEQVNGIDVIIGGHSHNRMREALRVGGTLIVQAGAHGSDLGRLDLEVENQRVTLRSRSLQPLDNATVPADPSIQKVLASLRREHAPRMDRTIGQLASPLARAQTLGGDKARQRKEESPADDLFADILRQELASDIALLPGVGYGVALPPGPVTESLLRNLIPHHTRVVTLTLTGAQIREVLEQAVENTFTKDPRRKVGGMIQVSGLRFSYRQENAPGNRVVSVHVKTEPLKNARRYRVATNAMLAEGGHHYRTFNKGQDRKEDDEMFVVIERWWRRQTAAVPAPPVGLRIREESSSRSAGPVSR